MLPQGQVSRPALRGILALFSSQDDPNLRPLVPAPTVVITEHCVDEEAGTFETAGDLPDRQRAKRQVEPMLGRVPAPPLDVPLLECRQSMRPILANRFNHGEV